MELVTAAYTHDEDEFRVVVSGYGTSMTAAAPDVTAARELVDRLVTQLIPANGSVPVVVHLLDGDAIAFTRAYLAAQLGLPPPQPHG